MTTSQDSGSEKIIFTEDIQNRRTLEWEKLSQQQQQRFLRGKRKIIIPTLATSLWRWRQKRPRMCLPGPSWPCPRGTRRASLSWPGSPRGLRWATAATGTRSGRGQYFADNFILNTPIFFTCLNNYSISWKNIHRETRVLPPEEFHHLLAKVDGIDRKVSTNIN